MAKSTAAAAAAVIAAVVWRVLRELVANLHTIFWYVQHLLLLLLLLHERHPTSKQVEPR